MQTQKRKRYLIKNYGSFKNKKILFRCFLVIFPDGRKRMFRPCFSSEELDYLAVELLISLTYISSALDSGEMKGVKVSFFVDFSKLFLTLTSLENRSLVWLRESRCARFLVLLIEINY
jgi:hypothetical protein